MRVSIRSRSTSWSAALRCSHGVVVPGSGYAIAPWAPRRIESTHSANGSARCCARSVVSAASTSAETTTYGSASTPGRNAARYASTVPSTFDGLTW